VIYHCVTRVLDRKFAFGKEILEIVMKAEGERDLKVVKKGMKRAVADAALAQLEREGSAEGDWLRDSGIQNQECSL